MTTKKGNHPERRATSSQRRFASGLERAIALASEDGAALIDLFESDWESVDRARRRIGEAGYGTRILVHHAEAERIARRVEEALRASA